MALCVEPPSVRASGRIRAPGLRRLIVAGREGAVQLAGRGHPQVSDTIRDAHLHQPAVPLHRIVSRSVSLRHVPKTHIRDVTTVTEPVVRGAYDGDWKARLAVDVSGGEPRTIRARVFDADDREVPFSGTASAECELTFARPRLWSAECPNLYTLVLSLEDDGKVSM